jgi:hypothetical protein
MDFPNALPVSLDWIRSPKAVCLKAGLHFCAALRVAARPSWPWNISPIRDSGGAIVGASKITRDITEQTLEEEKDSWYADS